MLTLDFPGSRTLIDAIDAAVAKPNTHDLTDSLRNSLCKLIRENAVKLPDCVFEPCPEHYARRELYRSEEHGYCVVAMTWGPGQGTPIHDHDGMWTVEGVWNGPLEIDALRTAGARRTELPFPARQWLIQAGTGSAGSLITSTSTTASAFPATARSPSACTSTQSLMTQCAVFQPLPEDRWYALNVRVLGLDRVH